MNADQHGRDEDSRDEAQGAVDEGAYALLGEALDPRAPDPQVRARLLAALRGPERWSPFAAELARWFALELGAVREALQQIHDGKAWHPGFWPGSRLLITPQLRSAQTVIATLPPGIQIPSHRHAARELTYVLDGVLIENGSRRHEAGTLLDMPVGSEHEVSVPDDSDCLVVFGIGR
jgi:quercetin dioxygenase-like cupin family protein